MIFSHRLTKILLVFSITVLLILQFSIPSTIAPAPIRAIISLLVVLLLHWSLGELKAWILQTLDQRFSNSENIILEETSRPLEGLAKLLLMLARALLWITFLLYTTNLFPDSRDLSTQIRNILISSFTSPAITLGRNQYSITNLLLLISLLAGLVSFTRILTNILRLRVLGLAGLSQGGQAIVTTLTQYGLVSIGGIVLLQIWGLDLSSLTIFASALSVGIGFGFQDIAKNFGSSLVLILERPIQVGDFVEIGHFKGIVEHIGGRSTEIRTLDHVSIIVPNSRFLQEEVINWSHQNPRSRLHLPVSVGYSSDPQTIRSMLVELAQNHNEVMDTPPPQVIFIGFGDNALDFELLVWTNKPSRQAILKSDLYFQIFETLRVHQIEIPFPQLDIHLRSSDI